MKYACEHRELSARSRHIVDLLSICTNHNDEKKASALADEYVVRWNAKQDQLPRVYERRAKDVKSTRDLPGVEQLESSVVLVRNCRMRTGDQYLQPDQNRPSI